MDAITHALLQHECGKGENNSIRQLNQMDI